MAVCSDTDAPQTHCCATMKTFTLLTMKCSSTIHTERTVAFPLQRWLRGKATVSRCKHKIVVKIHINMFSGHFIYLKHRFINKVVFSLRTSVLFQESDFGTPCVYSLRLNSDYFPKQHSEINFWYWDVFTMTYEINIFIHSLVFSLRGRAGRNQSPVMWPVWLWHTASWASSWG